MCRLGEREVADAISAGTMFDVRISKSAGNYLLIRGMDAYELGDVEALIWNLCDGTFLGEFSAAGLVE
jgi:hypothetical protein